MEVKGVIKGEWSDYNFVSIAVWMCPDPHDWIPKIICGEVLQLKFTFIICFTSGRKSTM